MDLAVVGPLARGSYDLALALNVLGGANGQEGVDVAAARAASETSQRFSRSHRRGLRRGFSDSLIFRRLRRPMISGIAGRL
jgi:hypothetical protein